MYIHNDYDYCPYMKGFFREDNTEIEDNFEIEVDPSSRVTTCEQFASILGGKITQSKPGLCSVQKDRSNLNVTISGVPVKSVLKGEFSFQGLSASGKILNLGEIVVLQDELNKFLTILKRSGIDVSAVHNHWIYDNPRILYVHFQSIESPLNFARKVAEALKVLK